MAQPDTSAFVKPENKPQATVQPLPPPPAGKTTASGGGSTWVIPLLSCLLCLSLGLSGGFFLWQQLNGGEKENPVQPDYNSMISPSSVTPSAGAEPSPQPAQDVSTPAQSNVQPEPETAAPEASDLPQQAEAQAAQPVAESERYRWDSETITNEMLKNMDRESIMWMRNEIYARHGYQFVRDDIQAHFEAKDWYVPNPTYRDSLLNQTERKNIDTIVLYEKAQGWRK